uniref:Uncharacterized protein n=1 Tax=Cacopsylla melanoneura TaxID=428564 RepID=A0A8D8R763_9HEMI
MLSNNLVKAAFILVQLALYIFNSMTLYFRAHVTKLSAFNLLADIDVPSIIFFMMSFIHFSLCPIIWRGSRFPFFFVGLEVLSFSSRALLVLLLNSEIRFLFSVFALFLASYARECLFRKES